MWFPKIKKQKYWIFFIIAFCFSVASPLYYVYFYTPNNSVQLYQAISFADDFGEVQKLILEGYEGNFKKEDFNNIKSLNTTVKSVRQFTLFEYDEKTYVIMTSPGTSRLKVLAVKELPIDIRHYFIELLE